MIAAAVPTIRCRLWGPPGSPGPDPANAVIAGTNANAAASATMNSLFQVSRTVVAFRANLHLPYRQV